MGKYDDNAFTPAPERALLSSDSTNEWNDDETRVRTKGHETSKFPIQSLIIHMPSFCKFHNISLGCL